MNRLQLRPGAISIAGPHLADLTSPASALACSGEITSLKRSEGAPLDAWCYRPAGTKTPRATLVSIHGVSRNSREHLVAWMPYADHFGLQLVAPDFSSRSFHGYQRLDLGRGGESPDELLAELLDRLPELVGFERRPACLAGFSGGAQFAHRFLLTHPEAAQAAVLTAAGWWTLPSAGLQFPHGCGSTRQKPGVRFDPLAWVRIPLLVTVGDQDTERDANLRQDPFTDSQQGVHRIERAARWAKQVETLAHDHGCTSQVRFELLPGAGHDFMECMVAGLGDRAMSLLHAHDWFQSTSP